MLTKILVLYNLPGTSTTTNIKEADEDTEMSAMTVAEGLRNAGYAIKLMGINKADVSGLNEADEDLVFNLVEWSGRDWKWTVRVIEKLEKAELPFTGSKAWGYRLSCDKILMKRKMKEYGIPTPRWQIFRTGKEKIKTTPLPYPMIVKPVYEHCAIGISQSSVVDNEKEMRDKIRGLLEKYRQPVLAEEFIEGKEAHVTVLEKNGRLWALPPAIIKFEKRPNYRPILTYEAKWIKESWEGKMSRWEDGEINPRLEGKIMRLAKECHERLGGRSYTRTDMRIRGNEVYALEINNNPGIDFHPDSAITYSATKIGLTWEKLLQTIAEEAYLDRPKTKVKMQRFEIFAT